MASKISIPVLNGLLGENSRFEGIIRFEGAIRIDGIMTGKLICANDRPSAVIVTKNAQVDANIIADMIILSGKLYGSIYALDKIQLNAPGRLEGKIYTDNLIIEPGAYFQGQCISTRDVEEEQKRELKKLARNNPGIALPIPELPENILNPQILTDTNQINYPGQNQIIE